MASEYRNGNTSLEIPESIKTYVSKIKIENEMVKIVTLTGTSYNIFTKTAVPQNKEMSKGDVLLLHGASFTSQNWEDNKTLQFLGAMGYNAVAIDLPGFGKSSQPSGKHDAAEFMAVLNRQLGLNAPIIISPSMSGQYSLPYLLCEATDVSKRARAFIPINPVQAGEYSTEEYCRIQIPAAVVYGENDRRNEALLPNLQKLPQSELYEVKEARHAAYLDQPEYFHKILYNFLTTLEKESPTTLYNVD